MAATRDDLARWFKYGLHQGMGYMVVVCDTFDHSHYPRYLSDPDSVRWVKENPGRMQRVSEIYDLTAPMEPQLSAERAMAI